ncbi:phage head-tail connector protein [Mammaliicoccus sciuri]|uniref:phage head-tail connector protein n=1 Tax=Mammaliicoccus sciuri TaxID=1296 RepID=UPI003CE94D5D
MISNEIIEDFKRRLRITHSSEDKMITSLLEQSYADIQYKCGRFNLDENIRGKELVLERTRYLYHDAIEYFEERFVNQIHSLGIELSVNGSEDNDTSQLQT